MNLGQRLLQIMSLRKINQEELAARISSSQGTITKIVNNKSKQSKFLTAIARELNCDPNWLETGEGEDPFYVNVRDKLIPKGQIPILNWEKTDMILGENKDIVLPPNTIFIPLIGNGSLKSYSLKIKDDSMVSSSPGIKSFYPGEIIIVDPEKLPTSGDFVIAYKKGNEEVTFKQYIVDMETKFLRSLNSQYPTITINEEIQICGVVIAKMDYIV